MKKHKLGLALAGGGVKGAAHVGVFKALKENDIEATCVAGTSAGALAAAFYAAGYDAEEIMEIFTRKDLFKFKGFSWSRPGLIEAAKYLGFLKDYFGDKHFEDLDKELHAVTTDLVKGTSVAFNKGPLFKPLLASCAFPFVFAPIEMEGTLHCDGGVINNFPVELVTEQCDHVLGIYVSPLRKITMDNLKQTHSVLDRIYRISNRYSSIEKIKDCSLVINPPELEEYGTFSLNKIEEIYELGYQYGKAIIPELKEMLDE